MPVILSDHPFTFRNFVRGVRLHDFSLGGRGVRLHDFRCEAPENGAKGVVLEIFYDFSKKLFLKNAIMFVNNYTKFEISRKICQGQMLIHNKVRMQTVL